MKRPFFIETPRLLLRDFLPGDWKAVQEYASSPKVVRYVPWGPNTPAQTKTFLHFARRGSREKPRKNFEMAIVLKSNNRLIGGCNIRLLSPIHRNAYIGYCLHPDQWGKGYATEASRALIAFGFSKLKLHRICSTCDTRNEASARVLEKAGLKKEGRLRSDVLMRGFWRDTYHFAILEPPYPRRH
jgi:[ribosomal protein S5]-alanine N-acetyltransferase